MFELLFYINQALGLVNFNVRQKGDGVPNVAAGWEVVGAYHMRGEAVLHGLQWLADGAREGFKCGATAPPRLWSST